MSLLNTNRKETTRIIHIIKIWRNPTTWKTPISNTNLINNTIKKQTTITIITNMPIMTRSRKIPRNNYTTNLRTINIIPNSWTIIRNSHIIPNITNTRSMPIITTWINVNPMTQITRIPIPSTKIITSPKPSKRTLIGIYTICFKPTRIRNRLIMTNRPDIYKISIAIKPKTTTSNTHITITISITINKSTIMTVTRRILKMTNICTPVLI